MFLNRAIDSAHKAQAFVHSLKNFQTKYFGSFKKLKKITRKINALSQKRSYHKIVFENLVPCTYELQHSLHLPLLRKWLVFLQNASDHLISPKYIISITCPPFCQFYKRSGRTTGEWARWRHRNANNKGLAPQSFLANSVPEPATLLLKHWNLRSLTLTQHINKTTFSISLQYQHYYLTIVKFLSL